MGQAKVRRIHLARTVIYCSDIVMWLGFVLIILNVSRIVCIEFVGNAFDFGATAYFVWPVAWAIFCYRLRIAFNQYLKFRHAIAIVIVSQSIVALFLINIVFGVLVLSH